MHGVDVSKYTRYTRSLTPAAGRTVVTTGNGTGFANQPANDGVEIGSDNAGDTQQATVWYTRDSLGDTVYTETVTLTGVTYVSLTDTDIDIVLAVELSVAATGTVTFREASGDLAIGTITATNTSAGIEEISAANGTMGEAVIPTLVADEASTLPIGLIGIDINGDALLDSQVLTGTTALLANSAFARIDRALIGALAGTTNVTITDESAQNCSGCLGIHNKGTAGNVQVSYVASDMANGPRRVTDVIYLLQGETFFAPFHRVWNVVTASGVDLSVLY